ncbi:MAG: transglutaminase domain-containing protein [Thermoplasmata archaeon]|nr:transglutaminase domain-containing protein [Thermoplasmata archaeon]
MKSLAYIYIIFVFVILIVLFSPNIISMINSPPSLLANMVPSEMKGSFERQIIINMNGESNLSVNVTIPYENTPYQNVSLKIIQGPNYEIHSGYNRTWITFHVIKPSEIILNYSFETKPIIYDVSQWDSLTQSAIPLSLKEQYDHPEYLNGREVIDPGLFYNISQDIIEQAHAENVFQEEKALYDYIVKNFVYNVTYSTLEKPQTAWETWVLREGDCAELSFLYASLSRAIGIPAWLEFGWLYTGATWAEHAWIGTVIPTTHGLVYGIIDLTKEVGTSDFGFGFFMRGTSRITEWIDDGNSSHLTNYYTFVYGTSFGIVSINNNIIPGKVYLGNYILEFDPSYAIEPIVFELLFIFSLAIIFYVIIRKP